MSPQKTWSCTRCARLADCVPKSIAYDTVFVLLFTHKSIPWEHGSMAQHNSIKTKIKKSGPTQTFLGLSPVGCWCCWGSDLDNPRGETGLLRHWRTVCNRGLPTTLSDYRDSQTVTFTLIARISTSTNTTSAGAQSVRWCIASSVNSFHLFPGFQV